jgi:hypothetical protein
MVVKIIYGGVIVGEKKKVMKRESELIINENFKVLVEEDVKTVLKKRIYEDGVEGYVFNGYFTSWEALLKDVVGQMQDEKILKKKQAELKDLIEAIRETNNFITKHFKVELNGNLTTDKERVTITTGGAYE